MANGIDWFRWHHGSVTDPKFQLIAKKAGASLPDVLAVWAYILESASASDVRGSFSDIDAEALDCLFSFPDGRTADIQAALGARGLTSGNTITAWEKRQPKREREDNTAAERKRAQRERDSAKGGVTPTVTPTVTPSHATSHQFTPREEESREEQEQSKTTTDACAPAAGGGDSRETGNPATAPLPARQDLPEPTSPALALTVALRPLGVSALSTHPTVIAWAERGVSVDLLVEAVRIAREHKPDGTIPPQYLAPIVERLLSPPVERRTGGRAAAGQSQKFHFADVDRSADVAAMQAGLAARGVTQADLDDDSPL